MTRRAYRISGRVQGVGFRWFVRETALGLGLRGYVLNRPDGDVETVAEGTEEALAALEAALREGPPAARVERVQSIPTTKAELPNPFALLHAPPSAGRET